MFLYDLLYNALAFINSLWPIDTIWQPNDMAPYGITELVINDASKGLQPIQADNKENFDAPRCLETYWSSHTHW